MDHYDAFLSYSHAVDGRLAPAVQDGLQRLARKPFQRRALHVFRDETGLSTNPHLWGSIETAIDASNWFVLLASPESARSDWVEREVTTWLQRKPLDHLLVVVTDGTLAFTSDGPCNPDETTCLPDALVTALDSEPRWLDLRWARHDTQLDLRNGRFRAAMADLAAPIHGIAKDDLESDDVRQQKRARRLATTGITAVSILAVAATTTAVIAIDQRSEARQQTELATARGLAAQATALAGTSLDLSLLLAAEGYRRDRSIDTEAGLLEALNAGRLVIELDPGFPRRIADIEVSPDGTTVYVLTADGALVPYDTATLSAGAPLASGFPEPWALHLSRDGDHLAVGSGQGATVVDLTTGAVVLDSLGTGITNAALSPDGTTIAVPSFEESVVFVHDVATGEVTHEIELQEPTVAFLDGDSLAVQSLGDFVLTVYDLGPDGEVTEVRAVETVRGGGMETSPDGSLLVTGGLEGTAVLLDTSTFEQIGPITKVKGSRTGDFFFDRTGSLAGMSSDDGSVTIVDTSTGLEVARLDGLTGSLATEFVGPSTLVSLSSTADSSASWSIDGRTAIGTATSMPTFVGPTLVVGDEVVVALDGDIHVAPLDDPATPDRARTFGTLVRGVDVAATAGRIATYVIDIDEVAGEVTDRRLHLGRFDDLEDDLVITMGDDALENVAFSPEGDLLALGYRDGRLGVLDPADGTWVLEPVAADEFPCCLGTLVWSDDATRLFVGGQDGTLRTFDTGDWSVVSEAELSPLSALRFGELADEGAIVLVPSESGEVFAIDATTGVEIGAPYLAAGSQIQAVTTMQGGTVIAAQSRDGRLRLWDAATRRAIGPAIDGHPAGATSSEAIDDDTLLSGGDDVVIIWDLDPDSWLTKACELAGRNLTRTEWNAYVGGRYEATCPQWPEGT